MKLKKIFKIMKIMKNEGSEEISHEDNDIIKKIKIKKKSTILGTQEDHEDYEDDKDNIIK